MSNIDLTKLTVVDAPMPKQSRTRVKGKSPFTEPLIETYREGLKPEGQRDSEKSSKKVQAPLSTIVPPGLNRTQSELEQVRTLIRAAADDIDEVDGVKMPNGLGCQTIVERVDNESAYLHFRGTQKRQYVNSPTPAANPSTDNGTASTASKPATEPSPKTAPTPTSTRVTSRR